EESTGEGEALPLPTGKNEAGVADLGRIAIGQAHDRFMQADATSGLEDRARLALAQTRYVVRDAALEERGRLRHVPGITAEIAPLPLPGVVPVEPDAA